MWKWKYVSETNETLSESWVQNSNVKLIKKGSLLFSFKLTVWRMCFAWTDLYTNEAIAAFEPNPEIMLEYLYYILPVATRQVKRTNNYWAPLLNKDQIKKLKIPLPPLETQKAIVAKLDQIFAELDQTKSEIQKNLDNTDELWKSALNQAFQGDWEMKKLGEVAEIWPKKAEISLDENTKVSFVPMSDLSQEEMLFQTKNENTISELRKWSYTYFKNDDVLLAKVTPCFENWKCWIAKNLTNWIWFWSSEFIVFRPKDFIKSEFLYYFVSNKAFREEWAKNMWWAVWLQRVKKDWIENHNIPVPPLSEQEKIVEHLDQVSKEVKALKSQYQSQLDNLEELKKSVLDKAFRWEMG